MHRACQKLLAGARLSEYQQAEVVARDARRQLAHRVERAAVGALDAIEIEGSARPLQLVGGSAPQHRRAGAQLEVEPVHVALEHLGFGRIAHRAQQVVGDPRLEQVLVDAGVVDARDDVLGVGVARDHDAHRVGPALAHLLQEGDAGLAGHALVAQDHADRLALELAAGLVRIAGRQHGELLVERAADRVLRAHLVVDDEDSRYRRGRHHRALAAFMPSRCRAR